MRRGTADTAFPGSCKPQIDGLPGVTLMIDARVVEYARCGEQMFALGRRRVWRARLSRPRRSRAPAHPPERRGSREARAGFGGFVADRPRASRTIENELIGSESVM